MDKPLTSRKKNKLNSDLIDVLDACEKKSYFKEKKKPRAKIPLNSAASTTDLSLKGRTLSVDKESFSAGHYIPLTQRLLKTTLVDLTQKPKNSLRRPGLLLRSHSPNCSMIE